MNKLETLLNSLIQMGWKPFGKKYTHLNYDPKRKYRHIMFGGVDLAVFSYSLRQLVSLESGLWQFCTEKGIVNINERNTAVYRKAYPTSETEETISSDDDYQYRLIESALVPEEELAQFLVDNIKVEGKKE